MSASLSREHRPGAEQHNAAYTYVLVVTVMDKIADPGSGDDEQEDGL